MSMPGYDLNTSWNCYVMTLFGNQIQDKLNGEQQQEEREARERALEAAARADSDLEEEVMGRREEGDGTPPPQVCSLP